MPIVASANIHALNITSILYTCDIKIAIEIGKNKKNVVLRNNSFIYWCLKKNAVANGVQNY